MRKSISRLAKVSVLGMALAFGVPQAEQGAGQHGGHGTGAQQQEESPGGMGQMGEPSQPQTGAATSGDAAAPSVGELGVEQVPAPEYLLGDASIFLQSALNTAQVIEQEAALEQQAPEVIGNQAQYLTSSIERAISGLESLQQEAQQDKPEAAEAIDQAISALQQANERAQQVVGASEGEALGEDFDQHLSATMESLRNARENLNQVAQEYDAQQLVNPGQAS